MKRATTWTSRSLVFLAMAGAGCQPAEPPAAAPPQRVESPGLGLAIAALPAAFAVAENAGEALRLTASGSGGEVDISVGPLVLTGINLVEAVQQRRQAFEATGLYYGNRELMTPFGTAYTARGQTPGPDGPVEETWVLSLHPDGSDRLLSVVYRYPGGGDSQARVGELLELVGELEPL